ncbi:hypothetical protein [Castellaniella defragrans]|uniref:hypothetical protein n=1 Tax=Castellaniella defragrans TaxID=75697 RepID=UPI0011DD9CAD|nr:hypothetical protein [Castellaniella defragrans]
MTAHTNEPPEPTVPEPKPDDVPRPDEDEVKLPPKEKPPMKAGRRPDPRAQAPALRSYGPRRFFFHHMSSPET